MSTPKFIRTLLLYVSIFLLVGIQSCKKKDKDTSTTTPVQNGTVMLHFHTNVDSNEVDEYNKTYLIPDHRKISVSLAQLYVSGIQLIKTDNSTIDLPVNILKVMEIEEYLAGTVPAGNYKSIRFNIGLPPSTNSITPATNDSTLNKPIMWFDATVQPSGYVFVNFQGKIDTSHLANNTEAQMQPFKYRIGTNANLKTITMPDKNYSVLPNAVQFIHITIDYNKLFSGIQLNNASNLMVNTVQDNSGSLATQVAGNIPTMFSYEE